MHQGPHTGGFGQGNSRATARLGPTSAEWNDARLRARKAAPATHRAATWHLRKLTDYLGATAPIASITPNDLALLVECLAADGLQTRSINQILGTARQFFSWATATDLIPRNPMAPIHNTRAPRRAVRAVPPHHVTLILDHADLRTQVIIVLLAQIGFRRGALAGIRWEDYDPGTGRLLIRQDKGARDHTVVLAREPKEALEKWRAHQAAYRTPAMGPLDTGPVFPGQPRSTPMSGGRLYTLVVEASHRVGLHYSPHQYRHTCATQMTRRGASTAVVARQLGHVDLASARHYIELDVEDLRPHVAPTRYYRGTWHTHGTKAITTSPSP